MIECWRRPLWGVFLYLENKHVFTASPMTLPQQALFPSLIWTGSSRRLGCSAGRAPGNARGRLAGRPPRAARVLWSHVEREVCGAQQGKLVGGGELSPGGGELPPHSRATGWTGSRPPSRAHRAGTGWARPRQLLLCPERGRGVMGTPSCVPTSARNCLPTAEGAPEPVRPTVPAA